MLEATVVCLTSLTGGWLKSWRLLHWSLMDLVYWASHSSQYLPDTGHVQENRLVTATVMQMSLKKL